MDEKLRSAGLVVAASLSTMLWTEVTSASSSGTLRIAGHVPQQAAIWFSQPSPLRFGADGKGTADGRMHLTDLAISGNNRQFTVHLVSRNAARTGTPSLMDPATGRVLPYAVTYGGDRLSFSDGSAQIADTAAGGIRTLELVATARPSPGGAGRFEDHLTLVIAAR